MNRFLRAVLVSPPCFPDVDFDSLTGYQVPTIPGTVMPVLLSGFQTLSFLIQPGTRLTIRPLQSLTPLSPMSLLTTRPVSRLTTSSTCRLLTKTSTVFKIKWMK